MDPVTILYLVCFALGAVYFLILLLSGDLLDLDLDFLDGLPLIDFDADLDGLSGWIIASFLIFFGAFGLLAQMMGLVGIVVAIGASYLVTAVVARFAKWLLSGQSQGGTYSTDDLIGEEVRIVAAIKGGHVGEGLVTTPIGVATYTIIEENDADLTTSDLAVVVGSRGSVLIVKKKGTRT